MQADSEFLKLVREYLEATKYVNFEGKIICMSIETQAVRRRLMAAVQEIIQRQSQPQLFDKLQTERN